MYSIMYVECLQYFSDTDTCQIQGLIPFAHYSVASTWLPEEPNQLGWNHSNIRLVLIYTLHNVHTCYHNKTESCFSTTTDPSHVFLEGNQRTTIVCISFAIISNWNMSDHLLGEFQSHTLHVSAFTSLHTKTTLTMQHIICHNMNPVWDHLTLIHTYVRSILCTI